MIDFERLEKNILDNIFEAHEKLGYDGRPMSLNYTLTSLGHLLGEHLCRNDMRQALFDFAAFAQPSLGCLRYTDIKNGFCITVPSEGTEFVHTLYDGEKFISHLIKAVKSHWTAEEILELFRSFSDSISITETDNDEFQYLVYFENGDPDDYRYCLSVDEEIDGSVHVTYHRFIREDYDELKF